VQHHIHESPATMTLPLVVLAVLSVVGGWIGWPHFLGGQNRFERWLEPVFHSTPAAHAAGEAAAGHGAAVEPLAHAAPVAHAGSAGLEWSLMAIALAVGLLGLALGWWVYSRRISIADAMRRMAGGSVHRALANKYWVDELYDAVLLRPGYALSRRVLWQWIDKGLIDGLLVNTSARIVALTGGLLRTFQNGLLRSYAYAFAVGVAVFVLYLTLSH
jgi:NADH-quinone oxidoreductase subunit L